MGDLLAHRDGSSRADSSRWSTGWTPPGAPVLAPALQTVVHTEDDLVMSDAAHAPRMGASDKAASRGKRQGRQLRATLGDEVRVARVAAGLSQSDAATAAGISRSVLGRIERGEDVTASVMELATVLSVLGRKLLASTVPEGTAVRDAAHHRLLNACKALLPAGAAWRTEVPLPNAGDLRSWDAITRLGGKRVAIEAETRPRDGQELLRRLNQKRRDGGIDRLILVLLDSRANRGFIEDFSSELTADFPTPEGDAVAAIQAGRDPGDAMVRLALPRVPGRAVQPADQRDRSPGLRGDGGPEMRS